MGHRGTVGMTAAVEDLLECQCWSVVWMLVLLKDLVRAQGTVGTRTRKSGQPFLQWPLLPVSVSPSL